MVAFSQHRRRRFVRRAANRPISDINVTPMVDVMLVLLVVFMVTAPLLTVGVKVDLPNTSASVIAGQDEPLAITVNAEGDIFLQETKLGLDNLTPRLIAISDNNRNVRIFIRGDKTINYGRVMEVMAAINSAGFTHVALITARNKKKKESK